MLSLVGSTIRDLHEGNVEGAAKSLGMFAVLARFGPYGAIAGATYGTISAYDENVQWHANQFADRVIGGKGGRDHPILGAVVAAGAATGLSFWRGVVKPIGTGIGEGAAALWLELNKPSPLLAEAERRLRHQEEQPKREQAVAEEHRREARRDIERDAQLARDLDEYQRGLRSGRPTAGPVRIRGSVGAGAQNDPADMARISRLLIAHGYLDRETDPHDSEALADGIRSYQQFELGARSPDGRIDPRGRTLDALNARPHRMKLP
jgi:hypothetical protein